MSANGATAVEQIKSVPATLVVGIGSATITTHAVKSEAGNIWFEGRQKATLKDGSDIREALLGMDVMFDGEVLGVGSKNRGDNGERILNATAPAKYGRNNPKAGQVVPGTGGLPIISFVKHLPTWGERGYNLRVTIKGLKGVANKVQIVIGCTPVPEPSAGKTVGEVDGELSIG